MNNKKIKIDLPTKNTILFIANSIYGADYSQTLSKKALIKKMNEIYSKEENILKLIEIIHTSTYKKLEHIYNDYINGVDVVDSFIKNNGESTDLVDVLLFYVEEVKDVDNTKSINYVCNMDAFKNIGVLFSDKGKELFKKEVLFENVINGLTNIYGVIKMDYFISLVNNYLNENFDEDSLIDRLLNKLVYNHLVNNFTINWKNLGETDYFFSFLEYDDEMGKICESQKQLNYEYNIFDLEEVIKRSNNLYDDNTTDIILEIKDYNKDIDDDFIHEFIYNTLKGNEKSVKQLDKILEHVSDNKKDELIEKLALWHNDLELYPLCGYSINTLKEDNLVS